MESKTVREYDVARLINDLPEAQLSALKNGVFGAGEVELPDEGKETLKQLISLINELPPSSKEKIRLSLR